MCCLSILVNLMYYSAAKQANALKGWVEVLERVPLPNGMMGVAEYCPTIVNLSYQVIRKYITRGYQTMSAHIDER